MFEHNKIKNDNLCSKVHMHFPIQGIHMFESQYLKHESS